MKEDIRKNTEEELRMEDFPDEPQEEEMINETEEEDFPELDEDTLEGDGTDREGKPEYRAG